MSTRHRELDGRYPTEFHTHSWYGPYPFNTEGAPVQLISSYEDGTSVIDDVLTPGYRFRKARGDIIMNDMQLWKVSRSTGTTTMQVGPHTGWGKQTWSGDCAAVVESAANFGPYADFDVADLCQRALLEAYARMNTTPLLVGENIGDIAKTVSMLRRPFSLATDYVKKINAMRKARIGRVVNHSIQVNRKIWLENRYGLIPIMKDTEACVDLYHKGLQRCDRRLVARASASNSWVETRNVVASNIGGSVLKATGTARRERTARVHAGVIYEENSVDAHEALLGSLGLRINDVPTTMYELMPLSFVIDWFTNVGTWIRASFPRPEVRVLGSWTTSVRQAEVDFPSGSLEFYLNATYATPKTQMYTGSYAGSHITETIVKRSVNPPVPANPRVIAEPLSFLRTVDALALSCNSIIAGLKSFKH